MDIKSYILTIVSVVVFSVFAEAIMPEGTTRKQITLVVGVVILITISKPVLKFTADLSSYKNFSGNSSQSTSVVNDLGDRLESAVAGSVYTDFKIKLSRRIEEEVKNRFLISCSADVTIENGMVSYVKIFTDENEEIKTYIERNFAIKCMFEKGGK